MELTQERNKLLLDWYAVQGELASAKAREAELRKRVYNEFADTAAEGVQTHALPNGYTLKITNKFTYKAKATIDDALAAMETEPQGKLFAERLVKWTPALSVSEYKALPVQYRALVDEHVSVEAGSPTVKIEAPKG